MTSRWSAHLQWDRMLEADSDKKFSRSESSVAGRVNQTSVAYFDWDTAYLLIDRKLSSWNECQDELESLAARGLSCQAIADYFGVTKNSVIGRANRTGLKINDPRLKTRV